MAVVVQQMVIPQASGILRAGYAFGRLLTFVSGGVALGELSLHSYLSGGDALGLFNAANGGQVDAARRPEPGAGAEWALTRNWRCAANIATRIMARSPTLRP